MTSDFESIYQIPVQTIDGEQSTLGSYRGKTLLIVNVASQCGFTPQYKGLEELHKRYKDRAFAVLGFPCDQFGHQEPGSESEIKTFCETSFGVSFPLFSKIDVNGAKAHPLYEYLKRAQKGILGTEAIKWNFTKFLVSKTGEVLDRFAPTSTPESLAPKIEKVL